MIDNFIQDILPIAYAFSFMLGACVASFLNVVIWRAPRGESVVFPPSHCPKCSSRIRWWQNIPILSWLALRGKCANCKMPISPRYILIELLGALLFVAAFWKWQGSIETIFMWIWIALMIAGSFIDFDHKLLPDFTTVGGMVLGLIYGAILSYFEKSYIPLMCSGLGLALGFGMLWLIRFLGTLAFKREAMGLGDVFLMGAVGALFGPISVLAVLILSSVFGSVVGLTMVALSKARLGKFVEIPFGPYICFSCLIWMFFSTELINWYLRVIGCAV